MVAKTKSLTSERFLRQNILGSYNDYDDDVEDGDRLDEDVNDNVRNTLLHFHFRVSKVDKYTNE